MVKGEPKRTARISTALGTNYKVVAIKQIKREKYRYFVEVDPLIGDYRETNK
jgi:hypothetical protein